MPHNLQVLLPQHGIYSNDLNTDLVRKEGYIVTVIVKSSQPVQRVTTGPSNAHLETLFTGKPFLRSSTKSIHMQTNVKQNIPTQKLMSNIYFWRVIPLNTTIVKQAYKAWTWWYFRPPVIVITIKLFNLFSSCRALDYIGHSCACRTHAGHQASSLDPWSAKRWWLAVPPPPPRTCLSAKRWLQHTHHCHRWNVATTHFLIQFNFLNET